MHINRSNNIRLLFILGKNFIGFTKEELRGLVDRTSGICCAIYIIYIRHFCCPHRRIHSTYVVTYDTPNAA